MAAKTLTNADLAAPSLVAFECATIVRRHELAGVVGADQAAQAHADLLDLEIELWPYELLAVRAWALRRNLSSYDASYVALAELLGATLITLDERIARAPGLRCTVAIPSSGPDLSGPRLKPGVARQAGTRTDSARGSTSKRTGVVPGCSPSSSTGSAPELLSATVAPRRSSAFGCGRCVPR